MYRAIDEIQPTWVVAENVAGILTMVEQGEVSKVAGSATLFDALDDVRGRYELRETFTLQRICTDLESHGYAVQPVLVPACAVGAPHRRDRVFIVARRKSDIECETRHGERAESGRPSADTEHVRLQHNSGRGEQAADFETQSRGGQDVLSEQIQRIATVSKGRPTAVPGYTPHPDSHRGREVDEHMESELADGAKPVSNGGQRNVADTSDIGAGKQQQTECEECGRPSLPKFGECYGTGISEDGGVCGERWQNFPSVSPVHRGNDGLPFDVDRLTLSFGKWRTEALKAYGNAIVPQVMYEIFRAIEQVEQMSNPI
jgi:DNA (cytosine-5)-methyltransferase 1